jgi:hypothetical protein
MGMKAALEPFSDGWLVRLQDLVNHDREMRAIGRWFTVPVSLACGDRRVVVRFDRGALAGWVPQPRIDAPCAFGFRATPDIWQRYLSEVPEPLYHDVFAMLSRVPGFVLEGDTLVAMQHARAWHRVMRLMRDASTAGGGNA